MDIFDLLTMIGGLSLFLFGMNIMGQALERRAGGQLRTLLGKLTANRAMGMLTGLLVTAVIQSSSATTVMVVGFVNSGLMTLGQAIYVIMGANVGTTITAWVLSLAGISSGNIWVKLLKPSSFTPVLALIGIVLYMSKKDDKRRDTGTILLGFATLMFGMETMSGAVAGLGEIPAFQQLFVTFQNPFLGLLAGAVLTALIQSSSASVGILQALAKTGQVSYGAAIPIIMGQNIGTCVTAMLSSVGANRGARRAAMVHLLFNVVGSGVWLTTFWLVKALLQPALLSAPATLLGIAVSHSAFNILCTLLMLPLAGWLERAVTALVPNGQEEEAPVELDQRLLATPAAALEQSRALTAEMSRLGAQALREALAAWEDDTPQRVRTVKALEKKTDHYEDILGTYLIRLSERPISGEDSREAAKLLKLIGDFERVAGTGRRGASGKGPDLQPGGHGGKTGPGGSGGGGPGPLHPCLFGKRPGPGRHGGAAGAGGGSGEGGDADPAYPAAAKGGVFGGGGVCLERPAHRPGAGQRPLLQHRRLRDGDGPQRPECPQCPSPAAP